MNILNPAFKYTPACQTDIRKTFAKHRAKQKRDERKSEPQSKSNVALLPVRQR